MKFYSGMLWRLGASFLLKKKMKNHLRWTGFYMTVISHCGDKTIWEQSHTCWLEWTEAFFWHVAQSCSAQWHYWEEVPPANIMQCLFHTLRSGQLFTNSQSQKHSQFSLSLLNIVRLANMLLNIYNRLHQKLSCFYINVPSVLCTSCWTSCFSPLW